MANDITSRCRLCLVTPRRLTPRPSLRRVDDALAGGDVASLIIAGDPADPAALQRRAEAFVPVAQDAGAAAIVHGDTRIAGRARADGVHIDTGAPIWPPRSRRIRPKRMVGAGGSPRATTR